MKIPQPLKNRSPFLSHFETLHRQIPKNHINASDDTKPHDQKDHQAHRQTSLASRTPQHCIRSSIHRDRLVYLCGHTNVMDKLRGKAQRTMGACWVWGYGLDRITVSGTCFSFFSSSRIAHTPCPDFHAQNGISLHLPRIQRPNQSLLCPSARNQRSDVGIICSFCDFQSSYKFLGTNMDVCVACKYWDGLGTVLWNYGGTIVGP